MQKHEGFSLDTVRQANMMMMLGIRPKRNISDNFSREDIERAWEKASMRVLSGGETQND